ncbi:ankyrin repeat protein, putative [Trichomonas vaginalis G3]|uniref:Ankyrin repeat protein, putative n=1 Tax=Trichomonas vaginalis (strain ATCC PRA-98 / G3) TaxID=412133 RepID=A2F270_TRIV3|nr:cyclin-dependent kinase inhibitor 2C-related family [Trichomonas vaginalis G3]EAY01009.1 ankyrin repeat protein, putative [Trichomonas vaginalis G3]KAI5548056.1 cyclin-dependent kinase inhibitor 2C-related family [Trichomonas vaginalis G3]|eukprot:XP_001330066.1 ankyrin repeat protein [Trichomonas vaginalis G3]
MSNQSIHPNNYNELRSTYKYYIDPYNVLYQLKTEKEEELKEIYQMIKIELIDSKRDQPENIIRIISHIIQYNYRYIKSYFILTKLIIDDYHVEEIDYFNTFSKILFYKEYGIKLDKSDDFERNSYKNLYILTENTIYRAIMNNDIEKFISFTEREGFDNNQKIESDLYPYSYRGFSLLELCSYHGAVDCFKFLITKFHSKITYDCLKFSFLGGNPEIMSECLKYQTPDRECMRYAIISHNIDFVTFLTNEYNLKTHLYDCIDYNNLESFLVYFDQTNDVNKCFMDSLGFFIPSLCEYFVSLGANINEKDVWGNTALHLAAQNNSTETAEILILRGANINDKNKDGETALHLAAQNNSTETAEILIMHGANINEKDKDGETALHFAARNNSTETAEVLIMHGANINEKDKGGNTALHLAARNNSTEAAEVLIMHGANIYEKNKEGETVLHIAALRQNKKIVKLLILHDANINEKNKNGVTALHIAAYNNNEEIAALLISHSANINEKDKDGETALHIAAHENSTETAEILILHGANINDKNKDGEIALHIAVRKNSQNMINVLILHGAKE